MLRKAHVWLRFAPIAFVVATVALLAVGPSERSRHGDSGLLHVRATEVGGALRISWDPRDPAVAAADSMQLRSIDAGMAEFNRVTRKQLSGGSLDYNRNSNDVLLELVLEQGGKQMQRATVRFLGPSRAAAAAP